MNIPHRDRGELPPECLGARLALDEATRGPEQTHLRDCPSCSAWAARVGQLEKGIKSLPPVGVRDRALKVLARANSQGVEWAFSIPQGADTDSEHYQDINKRARGRSNAARKLSYAAGLLAALMLLSIGMWLGKHQEQAYQQRLASLAAKSSSSKTMEEGKILGIQVADSEIDPKAQMLAWHFVSTRVQDDVAALFIENEKVKSEALVRENKLFSSNFDSESVKKQDKWPVEAQPPFPGGGANKAPGEIEYRQAGSRDKSNPVTLQGMAPGLPELHEGLPQPAPSNAPVPAPKGVPSAPVAGSDAVVKPLQPKMLSKDNAGGLGGGDKTPKSDADSGKDPRSKIRDEAGKEVARFQKLPEERGTNKSVASPDVDNKKNGTGSALDGSFGMRSMVPGQPAPTPTPLAAKENASRAPRDLPANGVLPQENFLELKRSGSASLSGATAWFFYRVREELKNYEAQPERFDFFGPGLAKRKLAKTSDPEFLKVEAELKVHAKNLEDLAPKMLATAMAFPEKDRKEALHKLANEWQRQGSTFERLAADSRHEGHKPSLEKLVAITQKAREAALQEAAKLA